MEFWQIILLIGGGLLVMCGISSYIHRDILRNIWDVKLAEAREREAQKQEH